MSSKNRLASVISEIAGPAPLLGIGILEVGIRERSLVPTIIAVVTLALGPYLATVWMAHTGKVGDRFVADRRQRAPIFVGTLILVIAGLVALIAIHAPAGLVWMSGAAIAALVIVTVITFKWKISVHATIAGFFAGLQVVLFGPVGLIALVVPAAVCWARLKLGVHTKAQVLAGSLLGLVVSAGYAFVTSGWL